MTAPALPYRANANSASTSASNKRPSLPTIPSVSASSVKNVSNHTATASVSDFSPPRESRQSSIVRHRPKARPQYPADSEEKHVEYILVASFDIDRGSIMEHQYPASIGGDEPMLAELMLPDGAHVRSQDWTIFFLHKDTAEVDERRERKAAKKETRLARKNARLDTTHGAYDRRPSTQGQADHNGDGYDDSDDDTDAEEENALQSIEGPPLVYVLNLVNTKQDNTVKRGAIVKAMAICTRHSFLHIYKPLLLLALEEYFRAPVPETLASLYDAVNEMDLSLLPRLSWQERFILQASDVKDLFIEKFEYMVQQRISADRSSQHTHPSQPRQRYPMPRDTHEFDSVVRYNNIPVPVKIPTALSAETVGDFSLIKLIQTFSNPHSTAPAPFTSHHPHLTTSGPLTHPIVVLVNALLTQKRVIFIGHQLPSSDVAEAVLAACALASGGLLRGFTRHAFPYTDLTKIEDLLKVPGFIAGVTNPTFKHKSEWWDLLCDLPTGRMFISPKVEQAPVTEGVLNFQQAASAAGSSFSTSAIVSGASSSLSSGMGGVPLLPTGVGDPTGDNAFMTSVLASISERRGEGAIRAKFRLWVSKFIRLAAAFEEMVYGASALTIHYAVPESPTANLQSPIMPVQTPQSPMVDPAVMGHGYVWPTNADKVRELAANATRIEGWAKTRSYYNFVQDFAVLFALRPIQDLDLLHLHDKLTKLRLGADASAAIYIAFCNRIQTYEQVNQLLGVLVNASLSSGSSTAMIGTGGGGLFHIALGLFHPRPEVRELVAELLGRIKAHEAGRHFWAKLGRFEKAAWERVVVARQEREFA